MICIAIFSSVEKQLNTQFKHIYLNCLTWKIIFYSIYPVLNPDNPNRHYTNLDIYLSPLRSNQCNLIYSVTG